MSADLLTAGGHHAVQFYRGGDDLSAVAGDYLGAGLAGGGAAAVFATPEHCYLLNRWLADHSIDVEKATADGSLVLMDASSVLARFADGDVDPAAFDAAVGSIVREMALGGRPIRAFGEMVALLWGAGDTIGALELERLWNELRQEVAFSLLCGYPSTVLDAPAESLGRLAAICHAHGEVLGASPADAQAERCACFPRSGRSASEARRFVDDVLRSWKLTELVDDAALVVTELAANAITHGRSDFTVSMSRLAAAVRIAVGDAGASAPVPASPDADTPNGRGLVLVDALSCGWGHVALPIGKLVWAELEPPATGAPSLT